MKKMVLKPYNIEEASPEDEKGFDLLKKDTYRK